MSEYVEKTYSYVIRLLRTPLPVNAVLSQKERMRRKEMENVAR